MGTRQPRPAALGSTPVTSSATTVEWPAHNRTACCIAHQPHFKHSAREASRHSALGTEQATELVADPVAELASEHATELVQDPPRGRCHSVIPDRRLSHGRGPSRHVFVNCLRSFTLIDAPVH